MAISTSTLGVTAGALTGSVVASNTTSNTFKFGGGGYGYDPVVDTFFGIPARDFHRMPSSEQRYYVERWEHLRDRESRYSREADAHRHRMMFHGDWDSTMSVKVSEPSWKSNTKLLLTGEIA